MAGIEILLFGLIVFIIAFYAICPLLGFIIEQTVDVCMKEQGTYERYMSLGLIFLAVIFCMSLIGYNVYSLIAGFFI